MDLQSVFERRRRSLTGRSRGEEVPDLVGEGVFPADDVALRPPSREVRVVGFVDQDPPDTLLTNRHRGIKEVQFVQVLQVKRQGTCGALDLDRQAVLSAGRNPGRLNGSAHAAGKPKRCPYGVVDRDIFQPAGRTT